MKMAAHAQVATRQDRRGNDLVLSGKSTNHPSHSLDNRKMSCFDQPTIHNQMIVNLLPQKAKKRVNLRIKKPWPSTFSRHFRLTDVF